MKTKMKKNQFFRNLMTIVITAIVTFSITILWVYGGTNNKMSTSSIGSIFLSDSLESKLNLINKKIELEFIGEEKTEEELMEGAIKGYVAALGDEYTEYFPKEEMEEYSADTSGKYVGIGVEITLNEISNEIVVYNTIKNSPAKKAGIEPGDVIIEVDGEQCNGNNYDTITERIKGKIGTNVKIKVKRKIAQENEETNSVEDDNQEEIIEFEIKRANVELVGVDSMMLDNKIGYIYISTFDGFKLAEQFEEEYDNLVNQGMKSLIVDVRTNGGGIVDEATDIADLFVEKGKTLLIEKNKEGKEQLVISKKDRKISMKTALLVNEYSASASEILAGTLKDLCEDVTIIGNNTYGKGVIQTLYELTDGSGLKITTEEYFTPNGNTINKKGVEPDIKVIDDEIFLGKLDKNKDKSLKRAIEILK